MSDNVAMYALNKENILLQVVINTCNNSTRSFPLAKAPSFYCIFTEEEVCIGHRTFRDR